MRAENDWVRAVGLGRIQDKTRWTKALGEAVTVAYGDWNEGRRRANIAALVIVYERAAFKLTCELNWRSPRSENEPRKGKR